MYEESKMKIMDLSLSNKVAGEGLLRWKVEVDLPGYHIHITGAEVCPLGPQVLLSVFGGHTKQTKHKVEVFLGNG
jgi:hypothetical protein